MTDWKRVWESGHPVPGDDQHPHCGQCHVRFPRLSLRARRGKVGPYSMGPDARIGWFCPACHEAFETMEAMG
jgi:hypothetical protein